ncbi:hypothetical protein D9C73_018751 [Collichthys lucidus]|uniref:Uncharacterized protein n=1 Tax=Collichthys lucidus TaxID=240159 RepID=A0A4U5VAC7_COLLU|nr:hypothetical protein D9C73_018751 [Collichthys lucidus]
MRTQPRQDVADKVCLQPALQAVVHFRHNRHSWSGLLRASVRPRWRRDIRANESRETMETHPTQIRNR